ncbi:hypothetical protein BGX34_008018 [Mortierella sp. NVP85]|nr:hypothetical protein BGX34_008018 [Mortierella sp. NVP85]
MTQSFCLVGKSDIEEIRCSLVDGTDVIFWEDIEKVFPGVQYVKNGNVTVSPLKDSSGNRIVPHRIEHFPGEVLNVVLSNHAGHDPVTFSTMSPSQKDSTLPGASIDNHFAGTLNGNDNFSTIPWTNPSIGVDEESGTIPAPKQCVNRVSHKVIESNVEQHLDASLPSDVQAKICVSMNKTDEENETTNRIMDLVSENNELTTLVTNLQDTINAKQDEVKQLQIQAFDRLALIRNNVKSMLERTYELHESPIPRLFIVLPAENSSWNPIDLFSNKLRLYFLCECGEHTKSTNSKIPHHIHLANHEGYDIINTRKFFQKYGFLALTILRMLKFGISEAGIIVPAVSLLAPDGATHETTPSWRMSIDNIESGMDRVIHCMEHITEGVANGHSSQVENGKAFENSDLRQLGTFLRHGYPYRILGKLFRTVTTEGHVKWVCGDHFREGYDQEAVREFREVVCCHHGLYDEKFGRVEMSLRSSTTAREFYIAMENMKSLSEVWVDLNWKTTHNDFKRLRDALAKTNVGVLELDLNNEKGPTRDILNRRQRHDPLIDIMGHPSIQSVTITEAPSNFFKRSNLQSRGDKFPNLRHLKLDLRYFKQDLTGIKSLIEMSPNLLSLTIISDVSYITQGLRILLPTSGLPHSTTEIKDWSDLMKVFGGMIETLVLPKEWLDDSAIANFAKAIENGSRLKELTLKESSYNLREHRIKHFASIIERSELCKLAINLENEMERVSILKSIQWEHLHELRIIMSQRSMATRVMKTLVDGVKKVSGKVPLKVFKLTLTSHEPLLETQDELLSSFIALTSLKKLRLDVPVPYERMLSLFMSADLSQLQSLSLWAEDLDPNQVETLLDYLQEATVLRELTLWGTDATIEQVERMAAKGVILQGW